MTTSKIHWCKHCFAFVGLTQHDDVKTRGGTAGQRIYEMEPEYRCVVCSRVIKTTCLTNACEFEREDGADHCTKCLEAMEERPVTNSTGEYLKRHADIEHEAGLPDGGISIEQIVADGLAGLRFTQHATVEQIAKACALFSTDTHEVVGHVSFVSGKPVVALRRELRPAGLMAVLRPGSDAPLSFLAQRRAS